MHAGELRVVIQRGPDYGLFWQATLNGDDLYAGTPDTMGPQFSYHASGKGHVKVKRGRDRLVFPPSQPLASLVGKQKVGGWGHQERNVRWGYRPKGENVSRRVLVLPTPVPTPMTVDLWALENGRTNLASEVLHEYETLRIVGQLHVETSPQLFAVVWTFTDRDMTVMLEALARHHAQAEQARSSGSELFKPSII
jgi:hypothetical protein